MSRILIVDDDEVMAEIVVELLSQNGHMVSSIHKGSEAVSAAITSAPDLLILDYELPDRSGLDILRTLREMPAFVDLPIMMLTGKRGRLLSVRAEHDGIDEYLTKPFDPEDLVTRVETMLNNVTVLRSASRVATPSLRY
ncbi:PleD family two-component system response regulator [Sphingomonas sp. BAUL-RG-20F-R05-02]|uniref:response regulator n=1 Tax=Sphingomonas sp. BAUL-RG-20F-R05-02 TaxID=2914830 RepID=UPI001F58D251|nr:response regulator transcription factor [Sphingomonas sp. BAUL-RG-20F-R05-02]